MAISKQLKMGYKAHLLSDAAEFLALEEDSFVSGLPDSDPRVKAWCEARDEIVDELHRRADRIGSYNENDLWE